MVVAVRMNRKRLIVMLEEIVFIYDISNMRLLHQQLTPINPSGICAVSPNSEHNFLALPHYVKSPPNPQAAHAPKAITKEQISGDVLLYDLNKMEEVTVIQAHQTPVSYLAINNNGTLLATASEKGTIIRIFSLPDGKKLYQFRRGSIPARIYCMTFNATSTLLCVSSATETVHLFKLSSPSSSSSTAPNTTNGLPALSPPSSPIESKFSSRDRSASPSLSESSLTNPKTDSESGAAAAHSRQPRQPGFMSLIRRTSQGVSTSLVSRAAGYLPASVTEIWEPQRDFAWARVPRGANGLPVRSVVAMANTAPQLMVATSEGDFYAYAIDLEKGGEGELIDRFE
jgi:autophagy-related protein 18